MIRSPRHRLGAVWLAVLILAGTVPDASARKWQYANGRVAFEGDFVRIDDTFAVFRDGDTEFRHPFRLLSPTDQHHIRNLVESAPAAGVAGESDESAASDPELTFGGQVLKENEENIIELTVTDTGLLRILKDSYGKESTKARVLLAVPPGFSPLKKKYPVLIVSSTTDAGGSSVGAAKAYLSDTLSRGYVVVAVDGEFGKPEGGGKGDVPSFRWALVQAALQEMHALWPESKSWPFATGGVSGGGGYASHQAIMLVQEKYNAIGMFLSVSGWNPTNFSEALRRASSRTIRRVPIFMSVGETDTIATAEMTEGSRQAVEREGFRKVRMEKFPGGHELHHPHLLAALDWFLEEDAKSP